MIHFDFMLDAEDAELLFDCLQQEILEAIENDGWWGYVLEYPQGIHPRREERLICKTGISQVRI